MYAAQQTAAADCLQRPLRSRFRQRLSGGVGHTNELSKPRILHRGWDEVDTYA